MVFLLSLLISPDLFFDRAVAKKIGVTRFELVTSCSQGRRANQAALHPAIKSTAS